MSDNLSNNKRIAKNTLFLYFRMFLVLAISLYTLPILLKNLGLSDYGLYNVVGGIVTMFSFIGASLASGSQRFIAYSIGKNDKVELKDVFDSTVSIYLCLGIVALIIIEVIGLWLLNSKMQIPSGRILAANWVFQFSALAFIINLIAIPYNSVVIAHEKMDFFAYLSIFEGGANLILALLLPYVFIDKLIFYAALVMIIYIIIAMSYLIYCFLYFDECKKFRLVWKHNLGYSLLSYSGWNIVGATAGILRSHGVNIVMNLFFGTLLNAAHSIALKIYGVLTQLVSNVYMASRPQITKSFASGKIDDMWDLVNRSSRLSFYLLIYLAVPVLLELDGILDFWLNQIPPFTIHITRLMIITLLIESLFNQIISVFQAENKIREYQISSSTILLLNIPLSYILLKFYSSNPFLPYIVSVVLSLIYGIAILITAKKQVNLDLKKYCTRVIGNILCVFTISMVIVSIVILFIPHSIFRIVFTVLFSTIVNTLIIWFIGFDAKEKQFVINFFQNRIKKS